MRNYCYAMIAKIGLSVTAVFVAAALPALAQAELGGTAVSVQDDAVHMQGTLHSVTLQGYTLYEIQSPSDQTVREYASADDKIFAVSWEGPVIPNLRQLLGEKYFAEYQQAAAERQRYSRGPVSIETPEFVFQQTGHMRAFRGRAYLPQLLPQGVDTSVIR